MNEPMESQETGQSEGLSVDPQLVINNLLNQVSALSYDKAVLEAAMNTQQEQITTLQKAVDKYAEEATA